MPRPIYPRDKRAPHETLGHWDIRQRNREIIGTAAETTEVRDGREWRVLRLATVLPGERLYEAQGVSLDEPLSELIEGADLAAGSQIVP